MRVEKVVTRKPWLPFGIPEFGWGELSEYRLILNKQERTQLERTANLLERIHKLVDPNGWGDYDYSAERNEDVQDLSSAEMRIRDLSSWGYIVVDDTPRERVIDGKVVSFKSPNDLPEGSF